jgi:GNAT superfamily N-acetyltransferase
MRIDVRQATPADVETVSSILLEAARWLEHRGTPMWRDSELTPDRITKDVTEGLLFLGENRGEAIATIKFQLADQEFWPDVPEGESAYIHRLAVRRRFAGRGVSAALMSWAVDQAASLGLQYVRLDCEASRMRLREVYERFGFVHHSDRQGGPYFVSRYQLRITA